MQVLEVYHKDDKKYYLLSRNVIELINTMCVPERMEPLDENTMCNWTVSAAQLRAVLKRVTTVADATNLMGLIIAMGSRCVMLCAINWQELTTCSGSWYDLKPKYRDDLEARGVSDGAFIFQGV
jgi:hypothetical protein